MDSVLSQPWFGWAIAVVIALPVLTVALTELQASLVRRGNSMAGPIGLLRTWILPLAALLVLLTQIPNAAVSNDGGWVRVTATVVGFLVLMFVLSALNAALFLDAAQGTWRRRMPSIFVDLARVILVGVGLAILFSWVWGTDVGGIFAALGVTSIVLGLALQNAVGGVVSGLLLLFEQPFQLGDWLEFGTIKGRVVEVNWRSIHIDSGNGIQIVPNAQLAGGSFINLSRPTPEHSETIESTFAEEDPPLRVLALLEQVAGSIELCRPGAEIATSRTGAGTYATSLPLASQSDVGRARAQFELRLWYAARRADLRLNGADIEQGESHEEVLAALGLISPQLYVERDKLDELAGSMHLERYAEGEVLMRGGEVQSEVRYVISGRVSMQVPEAGVLRTVLVLERGDSYGQSALTRTSTYFTAVARSELTVLVVPAGVLDELVRSNPRLARDLGQQIDNLRRNAAQALGIEVSELGSRAGATTGGPAS